MAKILKLFSLPVVIILGSIIIAGALLWGGTFSKKGNLTADAAGTKAISFINDNFLKGQTDKASLKEAVEESGVFKVKFNLAGKEEQAYISKDGNVLFPMAVDMKQFSQASADTAGADTAETAKTCTELKKTDKPELLAFIVSNCPYGIQMQRIFAEVIATAPALSDSIKIKYIGTIENGKITAMHGDAEAQENLRQICIREEQAGKYWSYVSCYMKKGDSAGCLASAGVDQNKLSSCSSDGSKGLAYAQKDFDLSTQYNAGGSPTLIQNGEKVSEFWFGGRTADALKTTVCCGNNSEPGVCANTLSKDEAAPGFSETYKAAAGVAADANANCATQ